MTSIADLVQLDDDPRPRAHTSNGQGNADALRAAVEDFNPAIVGRLLKERGHLRKGEDGRLWRYQGGVYRPDGDEWLAEQVRDALDADYRRNKRAEVADWCRAEMASVRVGAEMRLVNLRNGLLDWATGELQEHTPDVLSVCQLPVDYDPEATCPTIDQFLVDVLPPDALDFVDELIGHLMIPDGRHRKAVLMLGGGRNGKSTLLGLIRSLLGTGNVAKVPLQAFAEDKFAAAELYGKLANICGDLDARALKRSDVFKAITGGVDEISAQRKYGHPFSFIPHARLVFSANEAPGTSDQTDAFFDRWLVIPFPRRFEESEIDRTLLARMTTPAELSGLLNRVLDGLRRLDQRGVFDEPASVRDACEGYRQRADTVEGFLDDQCTMTPTSYVARTDLYKSYRSWCEDSGRMAVSAQRFNEAIRRRPGIDETKYHGERRFLGIGLAARLEDDEL